MGAHPSIVASSAPVVKGPVETLARRSAFAIPANCPPMAFRFAHKGEIAHHVPDALAGPANALRNAVCERSPSPGCRLSPRFPRHTVYVVRKVACGRRARRQPSPGYPRRRFQAATTNTPGVRRAGARTAGVALVLAAHAARPRSQAGVAGAIATPCSPQPARGVIVARGAGRSDRQPVAIACWATIGRRHTGSLAQPPCTLGVAGVVRPRTNRQTNSRTNARWRKSSLRVPTQPLHATYLRWAMAQRCIL